MQNCDRIYIKGLKIYAYHGCFEDEKQKGQEFTVDVTMYLDLSKKNCQAAWAEDTNIKSYQTNINNKNDPPKSPQVKLIASPSKDTNFSPYHL